MSNEESFQVRDQRKAGHHWADNEVLDVYGPTIGAYGYAVYMCISRFAGNNDGKCMRTYRQIGNLIGVSPDTVARASDKLASVRLISKKQADRPEQGMIFILLEVPKKFRASHSSPMQVAANSGTPLPPTAAPPAANSGTPYRPQPAPLPPTAARVPPTAARVPLLAGANKEVRLPLDFNQDYKTGGASRPSPGAVVIARERFWRIFDTIPFDPEKNRDSENMTALRRAAVESGLGLALARDMLHEHPTWRAWPYLGVFDSQQEIVFPSAEVQKAVAPAEDWFQEEWNTRKNKALSIIEHLSKKKKGELRSQLMMAIRKKYPQADKWPDLEKMLEALMLTHVMGENKDWPVAWGPVLKRQLKKGDGNG